MRYAPNALSFNTASALQTIYGFKSNVRKDDFYSAFPATKGAWSTHSAIDRSTHARKRRVLSHGFSDAAMRGVEGLAIKVVDLFCKNLVEAPLEEDVQTLANGSVPKGEHAAWSPPRNLAHWTNYLSYDVLGELCYGTSFHTLSSPTNRFAIDLVGLSSKFHYLNAQIPSLKQLGLDRILFRDLRAKRQRFMSYSRQQLTKRMEVGTDTDRRDFFYWLLKARDPETGEGFGKMELWGESNVLLIAGSDTTSTAMSATFHYLLHHPEAMARAKREVREAFSSVEEIVLGPQLTSCVFLRACIDESLRLSPPVPSPLPRKVLAGGMSIDGLTVPEGTVVGVAAYVLHRNAKYYPCPNTFLPERWIVGGEIPVKSREELGEKTVWSESDVEEARSAFCPFSIGPRGCIGKGVAYLELGVALGRVLFSLELELIDGRNDSEFKLKDCFVAHKDGPIVRVRRREGF